VQFTVYRPNMVSPGHWYPLVAFAHLTAKRPDAPPREPDPVEEVKRQAQAVLGERLVEEYRPVTQDAAQAVPREEMLRFMPFVPGVEFNPPSRSFRWSEAVHREEFRLRADVNLLGQTVRGRLSVFLGDILLADVPLTIRVELPATAQDANAPPRTSSARPYRKIFASYSHKDVHIVEQFEHLAKALGDEYLRDWQHLRAGEVWDERLRQMIAEADVFQLFWSRNAMESAYVRQEWEHALSLNRPHFVRPTYWEDPLPSDAARGLPPAELLRLHFQHLRPQPSRPGAGPTRASQTVNPPPPEPKHEDQPTVVGSPLNRPDLAPPVPGYEIIRPLGMGGMASAYLARHAGTGRTVVVSLTRTGPRAEARALEPAALQLHHPGIVPLYNAGTAGEWQYRVEPYYERGNLAERLRQHGPLDPRVAAEWGIRIAEALQYAHERGVYHFNLKPSEILIDGAGQPHLSGFGRFTPARESGAAFGTPAYMAPEQATGSAAVGAATDVYGLGALLYECLTGRPPFRGATVIHVLQQVMTEPPAPVRQLNPAVPAELAAVVERCLAKRSEQRYPSAAALAAALREATRARAVGAAPVSSVPRASPRAEGSVPDWRSEHRRTAPVHPSLRRRGCLLLAVAALVLLLTGAAVVLWLRFR
jgi:serine/threonine protein kinase